MSRLRLRAPALPAISGIWSRVAKQPADAALRALDLMRSPEGPAAGTPAVWATPTMWLRNPYLRILYSRMMDHDLAFVPAPTIESIVDIRRRTPADVPVVMHLHWVHPVMHGIANRRKAEAAMRAYLRQIEAAKSRGVLVIWTIHNVVAHDAAFPDLEMELQRQVLRLCDAVHVMSERTSELCAEWFVDAPATVIKVAHPSYYGAYPDYISRAEARRLLGIGSNEKVFLLFGAIKPYKGLRECAAAVTELAETENVRLIVAGRADTSAETAEFLREASANPAIHLAPGFIDEADVQVYFRAADISVLPYRRTLNSGSLALALTFALPVVMPADSGSAPLLEPSFSMTFDGASAHGLTDAMRAALANLTSTEARQAAQDAGERSRSDVIADLFARSCSEWVSAVNRGR